MKPLKEVVEHVEQMDVEEEAKVEELAIAFSTQRLDIEDIDAQDSDNPQLVSEYVNDIYKYLRELEVILLQGVCIPCLCEMFVTC